MGQSLKEVGVALAVSDWEGGQSMRVPWVIKRAERAQQQQGEGGIAGVEEDGGELAGMSSSAGLGPSRHSCNMADSMR